MCKGKNDSQQSFIILEENNDAIRLNFSIKKVQESYVTGDEEFLMITNPTD